MLLFRELFKTFLTGAVFLASSNLTEFLIYSFASVSDHWIIYLVILFKMMILEVPVECLPMAFSPTLIEARLNFLSTAFYCSDNDYQISCFCAKDGAVKADPAFLFSLILFTILESRILDDLISRALKLIQWQSTEVLALFWFNCSLNSISLLIIFFINMILVEPFERFSVDLLNLSRAVIAKKKSLFFILSCRL